MDSDKKSQNTPEPSFEPGESLDYSQRKGQIDLATIWDGLIRIGLAEITLRTGTSAVSLVLIMLIVWFMKDFYLDGAFSSRNLGVAKAAQQQESISNSQDFLLEMPVYSAQITGLSRRAMLHTIVPTRVRPDVVQYTVLLGDSIYGISQVFNLRPETIFWANYETLADEVHRLRPGQVLNILPVDGVYYRWNAGDGLNSVAEFYGVQPEGIVEFPPNKLNPENIGDFSNPNIDPGTWLVIPGGQRGFVTWSAPRISRSDPTVARVLGQGFCESAMDGPIGSGTFIWPTVDRSLVGYDYSPASNHFGVDIGGGSDFSIFAVDAGVVVFAGLNDWGYGNVIVIEHGNGWQSMYAHLSSLMVGCGSYVYPGDVIGQMGDTGLANSVHLHFELRSDTYGRPNPFDFLP